MNTPLHVIVGAGAIGWLTALELAQSGHRVSVVTRSGGGPEHPSITRVALDATDADALTGLAEGAAAIYNCANPPYHRWVTDWPPLATALMSTAERTGAGLVTMGNLYSYGRVDGPMTEETPEVPNGVKGSVRMGMWKDALAAHRAGRIRATEARASDFFGPRTEQTSYLSRAVFPAVKHDKRVRMPQGDLDAPHSWTFVRDVATTLATLGTDDRSWGELWHVPTSPARSIIEVIADVSAIAGVRPPKASVLPRPVLSMAGLFVPFIRELGETRHQFETPYVIDASKAEATFGLQPTPWEVALKETLAATA
ncbi:MAG: NAD-dependent epimerase/dehydratase family protein [Marmoricola sp.]